MIKKSYLLLAKYGGLSLYDISFGNIYSFCDKDIQFVNRYVYSLIGNPDHPDGTSTNHEYFFICDDLFDRVLETDHNSDIILKVIHKEPSFSSINYNSAYSRSKMRSRSKMVPLCHTLQRKGQKNFINNPKN